MSHQKHQVSARDQQSVYLQFDKYHNGKISLEEVPNKEKRAYQHKARTIQTLREFPSLPSYSYSSEIICNTTPGKKQTKITKINPLQHSHVEYKPNRPSNQERQIISKKLQEIDELRARIMELQWALSSQENLSQREISHPLVKTKSSCFDCIKRGNKSKRSNNSQMVNTYTTPEFSRISFDETRLPDCSKMTLDQMSTEVVFNSSKESITKVRENIEKAKRYRKRKKRRQHQQNHVVDKRKEQNTKSVVRQKTIEPSNSKCVPKNKETKNKEPKITNNNTIVLPELFSSNKSSSEEIVNLAEKLEAQNNEIKEIKKSLQECLELLRQKQIEETERYQYFEPIPNSQSILPQQSNSYFDDYSSLRRSPHAPIITTFMQEHDILNFLSPGPQQIFTCNRCDSDIYRSRAHHSTQHTHGSHEHTDEDDGEEIKNKLTVGKIETCHLKKKKKCCARKSHHKTVVIKYKTSSAACTNTSGTNLKTSCIDAGYYDASDSVVKISPTAHNGQHGKVKELTVSGKAVGTSYNPDPDPDSEPEPKPTPVVETKTRRPAPPGSLSNNTGYPDKGSTGYPDRGSSGYQERGSSGYQERGSSYYKRKSKSKHKSGRHKSSKPSKPCCPCSNGEIQQREHHRKSCFLRCLLCMFCKNL